MKGEKITSLDQLIKAIAENQTIVDGEGEEVELSCYHSIGYLRDLEDDGLYIKLVPEPRRLTDEEIEGEIRGDPFLDESGPRAKYFRQGMKCARDIMEGRG